MWNGAYCECCDGETMYCLQKEGSFTEYLADCLINNGVTVHKSICPYCCDNGEGHGMLKHSYDDEDEMEISVHPSTRRNKYKNKSLGFWIKWAAIEQEKKKKIDKDNKEGCRYDKIYE